MHRADICACEPSRAGLQAANPINNPEVVQVKAVWVIMSLETPVLFLFGQFFLESLTKEP